MTENAFFDDRHFQRIEPCSHQSEKFHFGQGISCWRFAKSGENGPGMNLVILGRKNSTAATMEV
jgi:hypothetical protein